MWPELAVDIEATEAAEDVLDAIPIIGLIVAVLAVVGDIATLAQAIGETVASPWVIANQISLTYTATVRVQHDPEIATWPRLARSWRLESKIDGATALTPVTGAINEGGRVQSDDLVLQNLTVPFGGTTVTLLFDSLVGPTDRANHVLLEPDDNSAGYHIRRLTIDTTRSTLSWDPNISHGFYALPVSAAALHSSGGSWPSTPTSAGWDACCPRPHLSRRWPPTRPGPARRSAPPEVSPTARAAGMRRPSATSMSIEPESFGQAAK